jgi:hypothetical protein
VRETKFESSPGLWVIVAIVVGLNIWYDVYHPMGLIFDAFLAVVALCAYLKRA